MATTARVRRPFAPKASTKVEVSTDPKPSIWTRIKATATRVVSAVKRGTVVAAKTVAKPFKAIARKAKPVASKAWSKTKPMATKVSTVASKVWTKALRPFVRSLLQGFAIVVVTVGLFVAPLTTVVLLAACGLFFLGFAHGVEILEKRAEAGSNAARIALRIIEVIGLLGIALVDVVAVLLTLAMSFASAPFAVFAALCVTLTYFSVRGAVTISMLVFAALTGDAVTAVIWLVFFAPLELRARKKTPAAETPAAETPVAETPVAETPVAESTSKGDVTPADAPGQPHRWTRGNFLTAKGTEELWGTEHDVAPKMTMQACISCGTTEGNVRVSTDGPVDQNGLCSKCFDVQCEVDAIDRTSTSLKARGVEFGLNDVGLRATPQFTSSKFDPQHWYWLETRWFRDRAGNTHTRVWSCLHDGTAHGYVRYDHTKKVMHGLDADQRLLCVVPVKKGQKAFEAALLDAQTRVCDELDRRANERMKDGLEEVTTGSVGVAPAPIPFPSRKG